MEIESCASGGARVDLGVLDRTDRIWVSDNLDPIERLRNQRYTGLIVPPEMMGTHITSPAVHTTGRTIELAFSAAVALIGHVGIEWDLTTTDDDTRAELSRWIQLAKGIRSLVAHGRVVNGDTSDPSIDIRGIISDSGDDALYVVSQTEMSAIYPSGRIRLPGLDRERIYRVEGVLMDRTRGSGLSDLDWLGKKLLFTGRDLSEVGVRSLTQLPQRASVLRVTATD